MIILAVANQKGGVAKTTTAANICGHFATQGFSVLGVDLDSQGNLSKSFGLETDKGLYRVFVDKMTIEEVAIEARKNLDILPNNHDSSIVEEHLNRTDFREYALAREFEKTKKYNLIVLDCPPSGASILQLLGLIASDFVLIPVNLDYLALDGIAQIASTLRSFSTVPNVIPPSIIGILPTFFDRFRTIESVNNMATLKKVVGNLQILPPINRTTKFREASSRGLTISEYAPKCVGAIGYKDGTRSTNSSGGFGGYLHLCEILSPIIMRGAR